MRILQVVTLISPDGSYGGPARVALNQSAELIRRGHDVTLAAAARDYRVLPTELNGVPVRLFGAWAALPGTGFAGLYAPSLRTWFNRSAQGFDVVHVHLARGLVALPVAASARRRGIPYVVQTHGMMVPSRHPLAPMLDNLWTRRVLRGAGTVFFLTPQERKQLDAVGGPDLPFDQLGNGVPEYSRASAPADPAEVLFVARIHSRKRPVAFIEMARRLLDAGIEARFTLIGPDAGAGTALRTALAGDPRIVWEGTLAPTAVPDRMAAASVYVLPSVREPYPMTVLEAMSVGLPVIVTDDCGLAPLVARTGCGIVTEPGVPALAAAVQTVLANRSLARAMGERARAVVRTELGMHAIGEHLERAYSDILDSRR